MAGHANATLACSSLAYDGSSVCCHAARSRLCSPARTVYQDVGPSSRWRELYSPGSSTPAAMLSCGKYATGSGQAREAGRRVRYQRSRLRRSALACAAAGARRRAVYLATDLERGSGRLFTGAGDDQVALELGQPTQHRQDQPAARRVSCILGGQVGDEAPRLFQIYDEGNFIEATDDTPYLQIGEHKYGKPILDRVVHPEMRLGEVAKLILLSFDATLRSNLSVGMPIDLLLYERDTLDVRRVRRIDENDDYYRKLSSQWADTLRAAVASMDEYKD